MATLVLQAPLLKEETPFFLPAVLESRVTSDLKKLGISYQSKTFRMYDADAFAGEIKVAQERFEKMGWDGDYNRFGLIISCVDPEDMYEYCNHILHDPDEIQAREDYQKELMETYKTCYARPEDGVK